MLRRRAALRSAASGIEDERWELADFLLKPDAKRVCHTPMKSFQDLEKTRSEVGFIFLTDRDVLVVLYDEIPMTGGERGNIRGQTFSREAITMAAFSQRDDYALALMWEGDDGEKAALFLELYPSFFSYRLARELEKQTKRNKKRRQ